MSQTTSDQKIKAISFDLDNTLWDVDPVIDHADEVLYQWLSNHTPQVIEKYNKQMLREHRIALYKARPDLAHQISLARIESIKAVMQSVGIEEPHCTELANQAFEQFIQARHKVVLYQDVETVLIELAKHYKLAVLTNGNANIHWLEIGELFDCAIRAEQVNASKPDPTMFAECCEQLQIEPEELVHVGDDQLSDMKGALDAGCLGVWFNPKQDQWQYSLEKPIEMKDFGELPGLIKQLEAQLTR